MADVSGVGGITGQYAFKWTKEQTEAFIRLRIENNQLFTGGRDTAANGYRLILEKMGLEGRVSHAQAKKKWDNLKTKYKVGDKYGNNCLCTF